MEEQNTPLDWGHILSQIILVLQKAIETLQKYLQLAKAELKEDILRPIRYTAFMFASLILVFPASVLIIISLCLYLDRLWNDLALVCAVVGFGVLFTGFGLAYAFYRKLKQKTTFLKVTRENLHNFLNIK